MCSLRETGPGLTSLWNVCTRRRENKEQGKRKEKEVTGVGPQNLHVLEHMQKKGQVAQGDGVR